MSFERLEWERKAYWQIMVPSDDQFCGQEG
ncbi:hypothetical protein ACSSV1_004635 [Labrenzia sp. MBR-25]